MQCDIPSVADLYRAKCIASDKRANVPLVQSRAGVVKFFCSLRDGAYLRKSSQSGEEKQAAYACSANHLRDGNPCQRIAIHYSGSGTERRSDCFLQIQDENDLYCEIAQQSVKAKYQRRSGFWHTHGKTISRMNIWQETKALCAKATVDPGKVFPHNLRHLFARVFYSIEKDIANLADIIEHSNINTTRINIISTGTEHRRLIKQNHLIQ